MAKTYDLKIKELEDKKSELDLNFLQSKKQEIQDKIRELLENPLSEWEENNAVEKFNEVRECYAKINEIDLRIQKIPEDLEASTLDDLDGMISFYGERKEKLRKIPLYRDTEEALIDTFGQDLIQYTKEKGDMELIEQLKNRQLTPEQYRKLLENMYDEIFSPLLKKHTKKNEAQQPSKIVILLPEWMSEQINEELSSNKEITPKEIEKFLKKELKNNSWEIKISHIKNTFKDKADQAYEYIRRLIINYPWFKIIDNSKKKSSTSGLSKREKLISQIINTETDETEICKIEKGKERLSKLSEILKIENTEERVSAYVDLYEEIWCKFSDRQKFLEQLTEAIKSQTHMQLENAIQDNLSKIIQLDLRPEKRGWKWYLSYKLSSSVDARRIIAYPNGEIFTISSHDEYEEIISKKPPVDKRRK